MHESLIQERDAALAALAAREVAAAAELEKQLAQSEREAASGGPAMAAKKQTLEDLRKSLQDGIRQRIALDVLRTREFFFFPLYIVFVLIFFLLYSDNDAFNAAYTAEKEAGKKAIEAKKAELTKQESERAAAKDAADKECKKIEALTKSLSNKVKQLDKKLAAGKKNLAKSSAAAEAAEEALAEKKSSLRDVAPESKLLDDNKANAKVQPKSFGASTNVDSASDSDA